MAATTSIEPLSVTSAKQMPFSKTVAHGAPVFLDTAAKGRGNNPSRAIANEIREVTTSTAFAVAAVVSSAASAINNCPPGPSARSAAADNGACDCPNSFHGSTLI